MEHSYTVEDICRFLCEMRLNSLAAILPERHQAALGRQHSTLQFLGSLLDEELLGRKQRRFERLLKAANLDPSDSIENYNFDLARSRGVDPALVRELIGGSYFGPTPRNIVLAGGVGTGKTKLARTLGFEAVRRDYKVANENTRAMVEELYRMRDSHLFPKLYRRYVTADAIVLDDLAYMPFAPEQVEFLFRVIFDRTENHTGPIIVTTNTDVNEWWQFFPSKAMGMAFSDRILGGAIGIKFSGPSIRGSHDKRTQSSDSPGTHERSDS